MKKRAKESPQDIVLTEDNVSNMKKVMDIYKNVLVCGIKGVGKITNTVAAVKDNANVYYVGNPVDHEGKTRPGSYEKYLKYIRSLKKDIHIVRDIESLFKSKNEITVIVDEIYGRSEAEYQKIGTLLDMQNVQGAQIVGCLKYMGSLIDKIDIVVVLEHSGAFTIGKTFAQSVSGILGREHTR
jgi:hypothetical protein